MDTRSERDIKAEPVGYIWVNTRASTWLKEVDISGWDHIPPWVRSPRPLSATAGAPGTDEALIRRKKKITPVAKEPQLRFSVWIKTPVLQLEARFCCTNKHNWSTAAVEQVRNMRTCRAAWGRRAPTRRSCGRTLGWSAVRVNKNKPTTTDRALCARDHDDVNYSLLAPRRTLSDRGPLVTLAAWVHASKTRANRERKQVRICRTVQETVILFWKCWWC